jgi:ubiquinone/menaquinone biosynthesis C-methylase UbiE
MPLHTDSHRYIRYLAVKREIDDRALSQSVWRKLRHRLKQADRRGPLAVIEMGGGIGTMFDRVLDWALTPHLRYTLIEANRAYLAEFETRLKPLPFISTDSENRYHGQAPSGVTFTLEMSCDDIYAVIDDLKRFHRYDLVMAHAVMDLVNIPETLNGFERLLRPGGLLYLTLNYDSVTCFLPQWEPEFEEMLVSHYHLSMDNRIIGGRSSGSSQSGRQLILHLLSAKLPLIAVGNSDWIVFPQRGGYTRGEAFFLETIVHTIERQLQKDSTVDQCKLAQWAKHRSTQIAAGELIFMARNLDILCASPLGEQILDQGEGREKNSGR